MNCNQAQNLLVDLIYEETDPDVKKELEKHLENCRDCASAYDNLLRTRLLTFRLNDPPPSTMAVNRILAHAREEAQKPKPIWRFGWVKVLSVVCVFVIAGGLVLYQSESGLFQQVMEAGLLDSVPSESPDPINRSTSTQKSHPAGGLSTGDDLTAKRVNVSENTSPPAGIIKTGTGAPGQSQISQRKTASFQVSISVHNSKPTMTLALPVPGSGTNAPLPAGPSRAGYRQVSDTFFSTDGYIDPNISNGEGISLQTWSPRNVSSGQARVYRVAVNGVIPESNEEKTDDFPIPPPSRFISPDYIAPASESAPSRPAAPPNPTTASYEPIPTTTHQPSSDQTQRNKDINTHLMEGQAALDNGRISTAIHHLEYSVRLMPSRHPRKSQALHHLAQAYEKNGDMEKARVTYRQLVSEYPDYRDIVKTSLHSLAVE